MAQTILKSIAILDLIYAQNDQTGINPNAIFRQTTIKNKNETYKILRQLQRARLIHSRKAKKNSQKKLETLTELGRSFMDLRADVYQYNELYNDLKQQVKQRFSPSYQADNAKNKTIKNVLLPQIYNSTKNSEHKEPFKRIFLMLFQLSPQHNIDTIIIRYIALLSRPALARNKRARDILNSIMIDVLSDQIALIQKRELAEYITIDKEPFPNYLASNKYRTIE